MRWSWNGLRPWKENSAVRWVAWHSGHPLISARSADRPRHWSLSAIGNPTLTNAGSFAEFVAEIREDKVSDVLFMQQYREPIRLA